jgi:predicted Rossmann fold flavoprotein
MNETVTVVGGGAAGLMAAIFAGGAGARTVLLERMKEGGRKILISGGGRCNVLPSEVEESRFVTDSSRNTMRKMLRSWPLREQRRFFEEEAGIELVLEPETGKLFPAGNRARDVLASLHRLADERGVERRDSSPVRDLLLGEGGGWRVVLESGERLDTAAVVLATGGLSVPATGSDGTGLRIAERLGHRITAPYPALTPLTADPHPHASLAGVSLSVTIRAAGPGGGFTTSGRFLITHRGYSGPSVLDVSHLATRSRLAGSARVPLLVRLTGWESEEWDRMLREETRSTAGSLLRRHLPNRLADALVAEAGVPLEQPLARLSREDRLRLVRLLTAYPLPWTGDEGYKKAEVTGGGVELGEVDARTLESRHHPGLYLCGELLDAFGPIGGYNFLWAWATGRAAGLAAAEELRRRNTNRSVT